MDNLDVARAYIESFNRHDADTCAKKAADDGKFHDMVLGIEGDGPDGLRNWTQLWLTAFPDANVEVTTLAAAGDLVIMEGIFRGTQNGPFVTPMGTLPASGKRLEGYFCNVARYRDGKLVSGRHYYDGLGVLRQLGVAPGAAAAATEARPQP